MSTHSRRQLIGGTASLFLLAPAAAGAAKAQELDGPLIAAAAEYAQLEDEYCVVCSGVDQLPKGPERAAREARMDAICEQQNDLFEAMCDMPARTPEGLRAKALAVCCKIGDGNSQTDRPVNSEDWLTWSLLDDLLGRTGA